MTRVLSVLTVALWSVAVTVAVLMLLLEVSPQVAVCLRFLREGCTAVSS